MSISCYSTDRRIDQSPYRLSRFDKLLAPVIASWVHGAKELFWLAPNTPPPLTPSKVVAWAGPNCYPLILNRGDITDPIGYVELNPLPTHEEHFWVGHCVLRPDHRGQGLGHLMVTMMLDEAFRHRKARHVSLVVFPENAAAIHCYRRAGFIDADLQVKLFQTSHQRHTMLRMTIDRCRHEILRRENSRA